MAKECMGEVEFQQLLNEISQETNISQKKLQILYSSRGCFSTQQASKLLYSLGRPSDKVQAIRILEPRLCQMSCREARDIIDAVSIHNDKLIVLDCIKRVLTDCQTRLGEEYILSSFPFENDKYRALQILQTVRSDVADKTPAGGHQGYAALGGLFTQSRPLDSHLYGDLELQAQFMSGKGRIEIPPEAQPGVLPSVYTGHPSYAYPTDKSYAQDRGYPGHVGFPAQVEGIPTYPSGAPPLGNHGGAPAPTGFPRLDASGFVY